jgi:hypothetical protein
MNLTTGELRKLTEFLGECWHTVWGGKDYTGGLTANCEKCGRRGNLYDEELFLDFTDWRVVGRILEQTTHEGLCPALVFDDDGHWQLCFDGIQPVGGDGVFTHIVEGEPWYDTPQEAICGAVLAYIDAGKEDTP